MGGGKEGINDLTLSGQIAIRSWRLLADPAARPASELPRGGRGTINHWRDLLKRDPNMSCKTNATRASGASVSSTIRSARPTASANCKDFSGLPTSASLTTRSGVWVAIGSSLPDLRARSMLSEIRAVIVVSQAQRFLSTHAMIYGHFRPRRHHMAAASYRRARAKAFRVWRGETSVHQAG
jgi:hypothetical protein